MKCQQALVLAALLLLPPLLVLAAPSREELDRNRRHFEKWRKDPEHLERLRNDAKVFLDLPEERRESLMRLDADLREESAAARARLTSVMDRYADWLAKLDDKDRQRIKGAVGKNVRLATIRELRDQEWMNHQPRARREQYARLPADAKTDFVRKLRLEEQKRLLDWRIAGRFWNQLEKGVPQKGLPLPARLADLTPDAHVFVTEYLRPLLSRDEVDRLEKAQGQWPRFPLTLVELADRHPPALPGPRGPTSLAELPTEVRIKLKDKHGNYPAKLEKAERHWPEFAVAVSSVTAGKGLVLPHELWPWDYGCLSPHMKEFVDQKLSKVMDSEDRSRLSEARGKWPAYPTAIQAIARKHDLRVPWQTLPDPPDQRHKWDKYRQGGQD